MTGTIFYLILSVLVSCNEAGPMIKKLARIIQSESSQLDMGNTDLITYSSPER